MLAINLRQAMAHPHAQLRMMSTPVRHVLSVAMVPVAVTPIYAHGRGQLAAGVSSFGWSGTIVHGVLFGEQGSAIADKQHPLGFHRHAFAFGPAVSHLAAACTMPPAVRNAVFTCSQMNGALQLVLAQTVADLIGEVDADAPLMEAGLDSLAAAELAAKLSGASGRAFAPTLVFNFPTLAALGAHLQTVVVDRDEEARPAVLSPAHARARACEDSTVHAFGASARLPGSVGRPLLLRVVATGTSMISQAPVARWDSCPLGATVGQGAFRGGFIDGAQLFDAASFRISPAEAHTMDPQQRHVLEVTASALRRELPVAAGTGVFLGISAVEFGPALMHSSGAALSAFASTSSSLSVASGRVSYCLGFQGALLRKGTAARGALARHSRARRECGL